MKTRIVVWGTNENEEKLLIGVELVERENKVKVHTISQEEATEEFYTKMMNIWREGQELPMPDSHTIIERELSITDSLLPDNLKTLRGDILNRAKTEWHFVVLSAKLYDTYNDEIEEIKERVEQLTGWDGGVWEEMKGFWSKVQKQSSEKNLFRNHANELRNKTNELFETMKGYKKQMNEEFDRISKEHFSEFAEKLDDIENRIEKGLGLQPIFNELKALQNSFKKSELNRKDRNNLWKRIDNAFKTVKEKKYGDKGGENNAMTRLTRRYEGLLSAIQKMEQSIKRDAKDEEFQLKRINNTDGQLELQIRQAKLAMIQERVASKKTKLDDMLRTKIDLEKKIEKEKVKEEKRKEQAEIEKVKASVKEEIAADIQQAAESREAEADKLAKAAEELKTRSQSKQKVTPPPVELPSDPVSDDEDSVPPPANPKGEEE